MVNKMHRYIDAEPYKDMLIGKVIGVTIKAGKNFAPNDVYCEDFVKVANVNDIPTADVQEVVRCKNCRFFDPYVEVEDFDGQCTARCCETDREEFCSYGSKRDA